MSGKPRPRLRHRVEFGAYRAVSSLLGGLPERWALAAGSGLGWLLGVVLRVRRDVVDRNLATAFADRDAAWRRALAVESYRHLGREAVMTLRLGRASADEILARTEVSGLEEVREVLARGGGALGVTGHLGNWELGGAAVAARGLPLLAVVFRQRNPLFHEELVRTRGRLGVTVIPRGLAPREVLAALRRNEPVALVADQDAGANGIFVDFLGAPASTVRGPALFSLRSGAPLFGVACLVEGGAPRSYRVHIEEIPFARSGDLEDDVRRLTQAHADFVARWVRRSPEQYFWVHKRWKTPRPKVVDGGGPAALVPRAGSSGEGGDEPPASG